MVMIEPDRYEAEMQILVKRDRVNSLVTAEATSAPPVDNPVTEEEINSEVELLKCRSLLENVVLACGLQQPKRSGLRALAGHLSFLCSRRGQIACGVNCVAGARAATVARFY